ncbi:hypothetical protein [Paramuribaculum intestinale]|uniref:hypothetical protein n=1 Tax=Paramuribaculum intestinale TaxID=2094151 RepID=UPI00272D7FD9|nr:hypothetical protein [Paramuribaculum intestinale]
MVHEDVQTAITRQFAKHFHELQFSKGQRFGKIDSTAPKSFTLQQQFTGEGEYDFNGIVGLYNEAISFATTYRLHGRVSVSQELGSPQIKFIGIITCSKF